MSTISVLDKDFIPFIDAIRINNRIKELADQIALDYSDKQPLFIAILNGSFMFASELFKQLNIPAQISFIKLASYKSPEGSPAIM